MQLRSLAFLENIVLVRTILHIELTEKPQESWPLLFFGLESPPSTLPAASRSRFMQRVAPVSSFPDRLRDAGWKVIKLSQKGLTCLLRKMHPTSTHFWKICSFAYSFLGLLFFYVRINAVPACSLRSHRRSGGVYGGKLLHKPAAAT